MNNHTPAFTPVPASNVNVHPNPNPYSHPPQQPYESQYTGNPATAAAANAFMSNYQQPQQVISSYTSNPGFAATTTYHSFGSPSAWRQFAGDITSHIDPDTNYLASASALTQLGRSEGSSQQPMPLGVDLRQGSNMNGEPQHSWPFLLYDNGQGIG